MNEPILFLLNIPADLTVQNTTKYYAVVSTQKTDKGLVLVDFLNLHTHLVVSVTDWPAIFSLARERAEAQWRLHDKKKDPDDLFLTLGNALNPVLTRQNFEQCNF